MEPSTAVIFRSIKKLMCTNISSKLCNTIIQKSNKFNLREYLGGFVSTRRRQQGDLGARGLTLASQAKSSQVKPSHGQVKVWNVAGL